MIRRMGNTGREIVQSGQWNKIGRKKYEHISGAVVEYDSNRYCWRVNGGQGWSALWVAVYEVEKVAREADLSALAVPKG